MKNIKTNRIHNIKKNYRLTKNKIMRGGVDSDSPRTKSIKKIQSTARDRMVRQTKKADDFSKVLSTGAAAYKKKILTMDLKGINLSEAVLSRRVLNGVDLQKVNFYKTKLNSTQLIEANLSGSKFFYAELKKADLSKAICDKCTFERTNLMQANFTNAVMKNCQFRSCLAMSTNFTNANLSGSSFSLLSFGGNDTAGYTNFKNAKLDHCIFDNFVFFDKNVLNNDKGVELRDIKVIQTGEPEDDAYENQRFKNMQRLNFTNSFFKHLHLGSTRASPKIIKHCDFFGCEFEKFNGNLTVYIFCIFMNVKMHNSQLILSNMDTCRIIDSDFKGTNFQSASLNKCQIKNSNMTQCIFTGCRGLNAKEYANINFTSASFNGTNISEATFNKCNFQGAQFIPVLPAGAQGEFQQIPSDITNTRFIDCQLQSITFQSTLGLQGRNFQGQDLRRCTFSGCDLTGTIFRDCNLSECVFTNAFITDSDFTGANKENTVFDGAIGREQNETLTPEERGMQVQGADNEIPAVYPTDVHAAFRIIKKNDYYNTIISYIDNWQRFENYIDNVNDNQFFVQHIDNEIISVMIRDDVKENKDLIIKYKDKCINERLKFYNYKDNIVSGSNPRISWMKFLFATLTYVFHQNHEFNELYITDVIMESATTYGEGGLSCDRGINERFIIKLRNTMYMMMDLPEIKNNIDKIIEYNTILNTIDPTKTLPTTKEEILAEREKPEKEYKDFTVSQELRDKWYEIHSSEGSDPFDDDTSIDEAMSSYTIFLKDHFKYVSLDKEDKERYDREMKDELNKMRQLLDEGAGMTYLFLGGRKMYGGKKIWNMDKKQFRSLCKKIFGKSKCQKIKNTKKLKKMKKKSTRRKA